MAHIRSIAIGIWMKTGSRDESPELNGISHFTEHMVFKGTKTRTARDIARQVDSIGGNMDAFTGKETICFNIKVLDEHLPVAIDILSDLVLNPTFDPKDITREKGVILEEIKMDEDNPDYLVHEIFTQNFWKDHPLGKPILGTKETVRSFEQEKLFDFYRQRFSPNNMIISAAGNLNHHAFVELIKDRFSTLAARAQRLPFACADHSGTRDHQKQEVAGTGAALSRRAFTPHLRRKALRLLRAEYRSGRRHEFAALPEDPRRAGPGVFDLQRPESLP